MSDSINSDIEFLKERLEKDPDSRLFAPLADAYRKTKEIDKAIELLEEGIKKHPDYASAHVILGKCFYDKGATERAKTEYEKVLELDHENMVALKFLADILLAEGKKEDATDYYKRLLTIDPTNEDVSKILKEIAKEFSVKELNIEDSKKVKDERPRQLATMTLAGIYAAQGYYNKALKIYRDILDKEPENKEVLSMVEKLQSIVDSSDKEREASFNEGDVLTISLEDISEEIAESSAGRGKNTEELNDQESDTDVTADEKTLEEQEAETERVGGDVSEEVNPEEKSSDEEEEGSERESAIEEVEEVEEGGEKGKRLEKEGENEKDKISPEDINRFHEWIKKLKDDN